VTDHVAITPNSQHKLEDNLRHIIQLLEKHRLVETMVDRDRESPRHELIESLVHRQHLVELQLKLRSLHPADIAYILEALPLERPVAGLAPDSGAIAAATCCWKCPMRCADSLIEALDRNPRWSRCWTTRCRRSGGAGRAVPEEVLAEVSRT
jgi:hypothetical protein